MTKYQPQKIGAPFHGLTAVEARQWYQDGLLTTTGYLWAIRKITSPPNTKFVISNVVAFCEEWCISRTAFYRAVKQLDKDGYMSWEATHGLAFTDSNKKVVDFPSEDNKCTANGTLSHERDSQSHERDSQSHERDSQSHERNTPIYKDRARVQIKQIEQIEQIGNEPPPPIEPTVEVEVVATEEEKAEIPLSQESKDLVPARKTEATHEDKNSAAAEANVKFLEEIERIAYDWKKRPWMASATKFKPDMIKAVWQCNPTYYSIRGTQTPNQQHIVKALKLRDQQLQSLDELAINAYHELNRWWNTAKALANPHVQHAFVAAANQSKEQVAELEKQRRIEQTLKDLEGL